MKMQTMPAKPLSLQHYTPDANLQWLEKGIYHFAYGIANENPREPFEHLLDQCSNLRKSLNQQKLPANNAELIRILQDFYAKAKEINASVAQVNRSLTRSVNNITEFSILEHAHA